LCLLHRIHPTTTPLISLFVSRVIEESRLTRFKSTGKLVNLFKELLVSVLTKRRTAHSMVLEPEARKTNPEVQKLPTLNISLAFEGYSQAHERGFEEQMRKARVKKNRKEEARHAVRRS